MGAVADKIGNKRAYLACFVLISAALSLLLIARELWMYYLFASVLGFAAGGAVAIRSPVAAELFGLRSHGAILGFLLFGSSIGGAIGPFLAGRIFDITSSYQIAFLTCVSAGVFSLISVLFLRSVHMFPD